MSDPRKRRVSFALGPDDEIPLPVCAQPRLPLNSNALLTSADFSGDMATLFQAVQNLSEATKTFNSTIKSLILINNQQLDQAIAEGSDQHRVTSDSNTNSYSGGASPHISKILGKRSAPEIAVGIPHKKQPRFSEAPTTLSEEDSEYPDSDTSLPLSMSSSKTKEDPATHPTATTPAAAHSSWTVDHDEESSHDYESEFVQTDQHTPLFHRHIFLSKAINLIPLIKHFVDSASQQNTLCFVENIEIYRALEPMIDKFIQPRVYILQGQEDPLTLAVSRACDSKFGCLVFYSSRMPQLPRLLRGKDFHTIIHVGWTKNPALYTQQLTRTNIRHAVLIIVGDEFHGLETHGRAKWLDEVESSDSLAQERRAWMRELGERSDLATSCLGRCYQAFIEFQLNGSTSVSVLDVVTSANHLAKIWLLCGNSTDCTIGGQLSVTSNFALKHHLKEAVAAGKLLVGKLG